MTKQDKSDKGKGPALRPEADERIATPSTSSSTPLAPTQEDVIMDPQGTRETEQRETALTGERPNDRPKNDCNQEPASYNVFPAQSSSSRTATRKSPPHPYLPPTNPPSTAHDLQPLGPQPQPLPIPHRSRNLRLHVRRGIPGTHQHQHHRLLLLLHSPPPTNLPPPRAQRIPLRSRALPAPSRGYRRRLGCVGRQRGAGARGG
ncbi:hypothetical protein HBI81_154290 [Parastagonospora nodorum]|nr:hypothetical protein HBI80_082490 [Parastagonospora nodorum]KAH6521149.1 hypothetical protein HBI81_154290 [Parastagonospora nodorum]